MRKPQPPAIPDDVTDDNEAIPPRVVRDRQRPLRVVVSDDERAEIERRAELANLSVSGYLRAAGLNQPIRSALDYKAVLELAHVSGDLGRLGGLLKLWLAEQRGKGASVADVNRVLRETRELQDRMRELMGRV